MPVRKLRSAVLKWPDREAVDRSVREWATALARARPEVRAVGYVGSYARGDLGGRERRGPGGPGLPFGLTLPPPGDTVRRYYLTRPRRRVRVHAG